MTDELYPGANAERARIRQMEADFDAESAANVTPVESLCRHGHTRAEHPDCFDQPPADWHDESARRRRARGGQ